MDTAQWPQGFQEIKMVNPMEEKPVMLERKARPQKDQTLNCPRCNSTNTKFCYYNNYSLTQPRYFCKTCRRYWTEGGSLRNVPVGGGSRKNKRSSSSLSSSASSSQKLPDLNPPTISNFSSQNPNKTHEAQVQDLNLAFPAMQDYLSISQDNNHHNSSSSSCLSLSNSTPISALELLRSTGIASRGLNSFIPTTPMPDSNTLYNSGFPLQELKPNLGFPVDGLGSRYVNLHGVQESGGGGGGGGGRLMFPFGVIKQISSATSEVDHQNNKGQGNSGGYWNGMLGGGSW